MNINQRLKAAGLGIPLILIPNSIDSKWPVIACDQFTQDKDYWEKAKNTAGNSPSALNLIFPEVFLNDGDAAERIAAIHLNMTNYLKDGIFAPPQQGFIYLERDTPYNKKRRGLVAAVDLEKYEWQPDARPLIRSTEGTVEDRLPPRMDIRRGAPLELPHVLLLIDDEHDSLLPALGEMAKKKAPVYDTSLMMESGRVSGWFLDTETELAFAAEKLEELCSRSLNRYGEGNANPFLFAVGDGNHSLAAAKGIWEEYKAANGDKDHPCRYALVEIENIYDPAIQFEPIHRIILGAGFDETAALLSRLPNSSSRPVNSREDLARLVQQGQTPNRFGIISEGRYALVETSAPGISTACLQPLLDDYVKNKPGMEIDYIHDNDEVFRLTNGNAGNIAGILLPPVQKAGLFETVARLGPLPRKSFSMGHSCEKRFYLECRSL
ncbi:MAG: DUF1015 domain-containing protein [Treponema sp.]|jgi:hypothetical protein|nr:DUF1015 domain-containing protein [Treponema sp.]